MNRIPPILRTIPSDDDGFREHVLQLAERIKPERPSDLGNRLRRLFPRVLVRERQLSGEPLTWYVYRDGGWTNTDDPEWWCAPNVPWLMLSSEGWLVDVNAGGRGLFGLGDDEPGSRHFTDFVAPGTLEDVTQLFRVVVGGKAVTSTVLVRPADGNVITCELHAQPEGGGLRAYLRLTEPVSVPAHAVERPSSLETLPVSDVAFSSYAQLLLDRMPEPTPDGLALRLRRLYPHSQVSASGAKWLASRDGSSTPALSAAGRPHTNGSGGPAEWWKDPSLPRVSCDLEGLIENANEPIERLFGRRMVGHYWQEFVTATSAEQVTTMLELIVKAGRVESRFRTPDASGRLIEFDSFTVADGETLTTVMRPVSPPESE